MRKKKKKIWIILVIILAVLLVGAVVGVKIWNSQDRDTKLVFTTGFDKDELFRIGSLSCSKAEFMVYLTNTQNQYENVYGQEIWNVSQDGVTLEDNIKETVLAKIAQIKSMYLLALAKGTELSEDELVTLEQAVETYYSSLSQEEIDLMGITRDTILGLYKEYAYANKVYEEIIADINPEISDDEARTITVEHILVKTYTTDGTGQRIDYNEERKLKAYVTAQEIREMAMAEGSDFTQLAANYSEDETIRYSFGKGELDIRFEEAAFNLGTDEISEIIETDSGYEIIKCINTFDREETDANKIKIVEKRKNEAFGAEYDAFVATLARSLNETLWEEIGLLSEEGVKTDNFFEVYTQYFEN